MPSERRIRVMISSRCRDQIELDGTLKGFSNLRHRIKEQVADLQPFGMPLFECWINEDSPPTEASTEIWDYCLAQVRQADLLLVLYNGNPGWATEGSGVGICHAELETALASEAAKVFVFEFPEVPLPESGVERERFQLFRDYYRRQHPMGKQVKTGDEALGVIPETLHEAIVEFVKLGRLEARKGKYDTGEALDWSRQDLATRKTSMERVVRDALLDRPGSSDENPLICLAVGDCRVLVCVHAVPAAMTMAAAREMVGRPFHYDYRFADRLTGERSGPVHLIACHRGVTERQAVDLLGQPDITTVATTFGVLAVDQITKVQCLFLRDCRDETTTKHAVDRAFRWLERSGEDVLLARRSRARAKIIKAIAAEQDHGAGNPTGMAG